MFRARWIAAFALSLALAPDAQGAPRVKSMELVKAAKAAPLSAIDYQRERCKDHRTVAQWLQAAAGAAARSIKWSGGACRLANKHNPRDAGTAWCAQATIAPRKGGPAAVVEIYFDKPHRGRPGKAFAFRALIHTGAGPDTMREIAAFEANWHETYMSGEQPPQDRGCN